MSPYQADRPRHARDIRGRVGLALDCRSGPGPRTSRCWARSSSDQGAAVGIEDGNYEMATTRMQPSVIVWELETVPDLAGFAAANDLVGKSDVEVREAIGDKFPKHIYH
jgi:hypothetical protein